MTFAIIEHFKNDKVPEMPWSSKHADLGIFTWNFNKFSDPKIISISQLCSLFALADVPLRGQGCAWVTISLDHLTQEPNTLNLDLDEE
ncbi:hypothetical protein HETIRDRAFT_174199 [Heterobasidion irregulare TC 32-1]|uniref:Uncharacterized protein n=1 Tax=Heterobasidion irregulare (strain TC 32-1) TaxID=747525 RepID=W4JUC9_HETIT|nr:uncharacterized protein HETIRDRAFT_174199 [Heterobasidion irregulare TC 32-1]ETW77158.1 hypothetical protein HETIRDRAFT_174199 [Heterobasidion irregulare TC 32-1]